MLLLDGCWFGFKRLVLMVVCGGCLLTACLCLLFGLGGLVLRLGAGLVCWLGLVVSMLVTFVFCFDLVACGLVCVVGCVAVVRLFVLITCAVVLYYVNSVVIN